MTIHMAKGLEYSHVYIVGLEEDLFPSQLMLSSRSDLEEERRLFYVAITRAKKKLFLSYALSRYRYGHLKSCEPSRFLDDIDPRFLTSSKRFTAAEFPSAPVSGYTHRFVSGMKKTLAQQPPKKTEYKPPADFKPSDTSGLAAGMTVEHPKFGPGTVVQVDTDGAERKARISFRDFGEKTLLLSFAKLRIVAQ